MAETILASVEMSLMFFHECHTIKLSVLFLHILTKGSASQDVLSTDILGILLE